MAMPNCGAIKASAIGLFLSCLIGAAPPETSEAPASDEAADPRPVASDRVPYDPQLAGKTVAFWEARAQRDPAGFLEWRELAAAYLARQRETGDIADAIKAERAARRSLQILSRNNAGAWNRLGRSLLAQHRFPEALEAARRAAAHDPAANRLVADIQIELGNYDDAERLLGAGSPGDDDLNHLALRARLDEVNGHREAALRRRKAACELTAGRPDMPAEAVAWTWTMLGHSLIDAGRLDEGERACREALAVFPNDYRATTGLAEAAAWRGDWKSASDRARKALRVCPQNPEALRLLGEATAKQGDAREAEKAFQSLKVLCRSFPRIYDRHWILFCADEGRDLDEALDLARKDLELRKDVFAYDALAWVCYKKGLLPEAERAMAKALARGTQAAPLYHHAGLIARASGDPARAEALLAHARELNPRLRNDAEPD